MTLPEWVKVGVKFKDGDDLWHVRAIVDDKAVCRRWRTAKQWWHYECIDPEWFAVRGDTIGPQK